MPCKVQYKVIFNTYLEVSFAPFVVALTSSALTSAVGSPQQYQRYIQNCRPEARHHESRWRLHVKDRVTVCVECLFFRTPSHGVRNCQLRISLRHDSTTPENPSIINIKLGREDHCDALHRDALHRDALHRDALDRDQVRDL
jgi:hypothetical protein